MLTAKIRATCPMLGPAGARDEGQLVLVARTFAGSMAFLLAIGLVNALEVTIVRTAWQDDGARPCYYSGSLHNVPLAARFVLCVVIWVMVLPALTLIKRSKNNPLRDNIVQALMDRGEWDAAAFAMRLWDRMRGLYLPTLSWTAGQALLRVIDHALTPHSLDILFSPETIQQQTGGSNSTAATAAAAAAAASLVASGCDEATAAANADALTDSSTAGGADAATADCRSQVIAASAVQDRSFGAACQAATNTQCSFDGGVAGGGGCLKWIFKGRCYSSDPTQDCSIDFDQFKGDWTDAGKHQCEDVNGCLYQNGTDVFGVCCEKKVLYGQHALLFVYCCLMTFLATKYLASRDRRMLQKLERTIALTADQDAGAESAQREFVLHWELSAMFGGLFAYMIGKIWNDSAGVWFADYKSDHPLAW